MPWVCGCLSGEQDGLNADRWSKAAVRSARKTRILRLECSNIPIRFPESRLLLAGLAALFAAGPATAPACSLCGSDGSVPLNEPIASWQAEWATHRDTIEAPDAPVLVFPEARTGIGAGTHARTQPQGVLSGRIVFIGAGHGWTFDDSAASSLAWYTQRGNTNDVVEDYGNLDQMTYFAQYLWNAGATVVPTRPVGYQSNEVVLDQDDTTLSGDGVVSYTGAWQASSSSPHYAKAPDSAADTYRFVTDLTTGTPTRTARYTPNLPEAGRYPVYTWVLNSSNRVNQEYVVHHAGGETVVRVNHRAVGKGWVWLGTYTFEQGMNGYVEITNRIEAGETGGAVIADAIRFGNGMGTLTYAPDNVVSLFPREEEASRYWAEISQAPSSVYDASSTHQNDNVGTPPRLAAYMNNESEGAETDRVYISFHTNASGGRGALGLYNSLTSTTTPNQEALADLVGREVNEDFQQLDTILFPSYAEWSNTTTHKLDRSDIDFGEIRRDTINSEMDATINEIAYHDNADDGRYLSDARARRLTARSTFDAVIRYFSQFGGATQVFPPDEPTNLRALNAADGTGDIVLTWEAPIVRTSTKPGTPGSLTGDPATGYEIYVSETGLDFTYLATVGNTTTYRVSDLPAGASRTFQVLAKNNGGVSFPSNAAGATALTGRPPVLVVDGFDRMDDALSYGQTVSGISGRSSLGTFKRPIADLTNNYSYVMQVARAIDGVRPGIGFDSCTNDAVIAGTVSLTDYDAVVWILGEESTADETFGTAEQSLVSSYLSGGGNLFVSGAEIAWDLDNLGQAGDRTFFNGTLKTAYVGDDANTYAVAGVGGSIFDGIALTFDDGTHGNYDADYPDRLAAQGGASVVMTYSGGTGDGAAVAWDNAGASGGRVIVLGFPFETIVDPADRRAVMTAALEFLAPDAGVLLGDVTSNGTVTPDDAQAIFDCYLAGTCAPGIDASVADVCPPLGISPQDAQGAFQIFLGIVPCN
ncbi:MAG: hypothetical protein PWP23_345 [Candidatus Sumerlaeota bacterium]|nr:hypothetical protein [Candidatus Sumerlaeota bacterium]